MLTALAGLIAACLMLGPLAARWPSPAGASLAGWGTAGLSAAACSLAIAALTAGGRTVLALPAGLPHAGLTLALDPLAAFFLLPVCASGLAAGLYAGRAPPLLPVFTGAMLLTVLAGDTMTLVLGVAAMGAAGWALVGGARFAGMAVVGPISLLAALAMLSPDPSFEALRAAPPDGWRTAAVLGLTLLGAGPAIGLAPLHRWLPPAHEAASGLVSGMLSGGMAPVGVYLTIRVLLDLCGPATPGWCCAPLLAVGAASAMLGSVSANRAATLRGVLAGTVVQNAGFVAIGLGVALAARGADLPVLASLALGGAMLHALNHGVVQMLATLCADAAEQAAATRALDRLGGLARAMPRTTACMLVAAASLAALPVSAGFAGVWIVLQTVIAAPRIGGLGLQFVMALATAVIAMAGALGASAAMRLIGVGFLGRPRSPRAAAAEDPAGLALVALYGLAGLTVLLGLLPGVGLALTGGARRALSAAGLPQRADWAGIEMAADLPGYAPLGVALLLAGCGLAIWLMARRLPRPRPAPVWDGGFDPPPPWLPFGDPATQYTAGSLEAPVMALIGGARWWSDPAAPWLARAAGWFGRPAVEARPRLALAVLLGLALAALAGVAWLEGA